MHVSQLQRDLNQIMWDISHDCGTNPQLINLFKEVFISRFHSAKIFNNKFLTLYRHVQATAMYAVDDGLALFRFTCCRFPAANRWRITFSCRRLVITVYI